MSGKTLNIKWSDILRIDRNVGRSPEAWGVLLFNLLVLAMVIFYKEDRYIVIAAYFLETLIIGIFNVVRMGIVAMFSPAARDTKALAASMRPDMSRSSPGMTNLFLIFFFILHFSIFYFVQLGILIGSAEMMDRNFPGGGSFIPNPVSFFSAALGDQGEYILTAILVMQLFALVYTFWLRGEYKVMNCLTQGMQPYGRIFLQQFVVLIGGFFIIVIQHAVVFSIILVVLKTFIDAWMQNKQAQKLLRKIQEFHPDEGKD